MADLVGSLVLAVDQHRWYVDITFLTGEGSEQTMRASADSAVADSGVWWGTPEEYEEAMEW